MIDAFSTNKIDQWLGVSVAGIITVDDNKNISFWNKGAERIFGYSVDEIVGKPIVLLVSQDNVNAEDEYISSRLRRDGFVENYHTFGLKKDGKVITVSVTISGIKNEIGELIGATYVFRDISEELAIDAEMRRLAATIQSVSDLVLIADMDNHITYANPAALERFGYSLGELVGKSSDIVVAHDNAELSRNIYKKTLAGGWNGEIDNITKSGDVFPVFLSTAVVKDSDGNPIALTGIGKDISQLKEVERKLRESNNELGQANRTLRETQRKLMISEKQAAMGVLASGIAHEIGNPLSSISSLAQLIIRKTEDTKVKSSMDQVISNVSRISKIIRNLVDLARPKDSRGCDTQIDLIIAYAIKITNFTRPGRKVSITSSIAPDISPVMGHPADILQAVINVLVNAVDAVDDGGTVNVNCYQGMDGVVVEVIDNGTGIRTENLTRVFQPFFTTKEIGAGAGLGLSVSYNIMKNLGGDLDIDSKVDEGTKVLFRFPKYNKEYNNESISRFNN